jgi:hypothetical protein
MSGSPDWRLGNMGWSVSRSCSPPAWTATPSRIAARSGVSTSFTAGSTPWATAHPHRSPRRWQRSSPAAPKALSHGSAAALWRIVPRRHSPVEVTAPTKHRLKEIYVHRSRHTDATTHYGIRVTTPARILVDLADVLNPRQLTRAPGPTAHHAARADHPPHPISRAAHISAHATQGRHPCSPRRPSSARSCRCCDRPPCGSRAEPVAA